MGDISEADVSRDSFSHKWRMAIPDNLFLPRRKEIFIFMKNLQRYEVTNNEHLKCKHFLYSCKLVTYFIISYVQQYM